MLKIAIVVFREFLEISILLSIIIAATSEVKKRHLYILFGILLGCFFAGLSALSINQIAFAFDGLGTEIFNIIIIFLTIFIIAWTILWIQNYSQNLKSSLSSVATNIIDGKTNKITLSILVAATIFREATEIVLYIYSLSCNSQISTMDYIAGFGIGIVSGTACGAIIYMGLISVARKYIFQICTILMIFIAASLASEAASIMTSTGMIEIFSNQMWDSSWLINDNTILGKLLKILIGYDSRPNALQLIFYFSTLFLLFLCFYINLPVKKNQN